MPPLPITLDAETQQLISRAKRHQEDLCLAAELREDVDTLSREIEALHVLIEDQRGERKRKELTRVVEDFKAALASIRTDSRSALLASKRVIDLLSQSNREELLASTVLQEKQDVKEGVTEDMLMKTSNDVTDTFRRTLNLMQAELERSVLTTQMLESSTATLKSTSTSHDVLTNLTGTSKQLIMALEKSDWLDRLVITSALVFFFLVSLFILKQRIFDRGFRLAMWFIPNFSRHAEWMNRGSAEDVLRGTTAGLSSLVAMVSSSSAVTSSLSAVREYLAGRDDIHLMASSIITGTLEPERTSVGEAHDEL